MEWNPLNFNHKPLIEQALDKCPLNLSDYSFTNLWIWNIHRHYHIALEENFICIKFNDKGHQLYLYPLGTGSRKTIIDQLLYADPNFHMRAVPEEGLIELEELELNIEPETGRFDYIYAFTDLLNLEGDHFQPKRNFIHQFENKYSYEYREITKDLIPSIIEMEKNWFEEHKDPSRSLRMEHESSLVALEDFKRLNIFGGALIVDQKIVAYTMAEYLNEEMVVIHIEKALKDFRGAYPMINQQLLKHSRVVPFVNREEDLSLSNLIKVKQSYHPIRLEKKFLLSNKL